MTDTWGFNARVHGDGRRFTLLEEIFYVTSDGYTIVASAGRTTDLASIPRLLWAIIPFSGRYDYAAILHDQLYGEHREVSIRFNRKQADNIMLEVMTASGVPWGQKWLIYIGVRLGGWMAWNKKKA